MKSRDVYSPSRSSGTSAVVVTTDTTGESYRGTRDLKEELGLLWSQMKFWEKAEDEGYFSNARLCLEGSVEWN